MEYQTVIYNNLLISLSIFFKVNFSNDRQIEVSSGIVAIQVIQIKILSKVLFLVVVDKVVSEKYLLLGYYNSGLEYYPYTTKYHNPTGASSPFVIHCYDPYRLG